ncbi:TIGR03086 family metal-binding protein [Streptacidiphilus sp. P02-A3a]|uniref:TIGR03086 family metal-binding protein n=1 Tax=Streptacidiphilus sp. P02-A3a TaxID=2704468 RepID=UPI0015FA437F|nr:TIGR03086 family metal-binding protein [Streptacidiphilus sp. P02-A3a]QMU71588.1 TIGR03086 family protein [Streptacidiphilus sp. P02-A3a]
MDLREPLSTASATMAGLVGAVKPDQLTVTTPCAGFDVRGLVNHLINWAPTIEAVGLRKSAVVDREAARRDHTGGDWQADYLAWLDRIERAWSADAAWEGSADVNGVVVPARVIGEKTLVELVVHGWDLARATGQEFHCGDAAAEQARRVILETAEETRSLGMFGPELEAPASATALERALACSGRDPAWSA